MSESEPGPEPEPEPFFTTTFDPDEGPILELHLPLQVLGLGNLGDRWAIVAIEPDGVMELRQFLDEHLQKVALWERANGN